MKKRLLTGFVLVMIVLGISLETFADGSRDVIQNLFGKHADPDEAQPVNVITNSDIVTCSIKDAWFDGETLAISIAFQTVRPIYLAGTEIKVNGEGIDYVEYSSSIEEMWTGNEATHQLHTSVEKIHGVKYILSHVFPKEENIRVTMRIPVLVPAKGTVAVDTYQEDHSAMWAEIDAVYRKGLTPIAVDEPYEVLISTGWWNSLDRAEPLQKPYGDVEALVQYANMEVVDTIEVAFMLQAR